MLKTMQPMIDPFGRRITYLRVSVTDRCDFRCVYCMAESMTFLPRKDLLTLEEIDRLTSAFIAKGVRKVRLTGGEPLVRKNLMWLIKSLSRHLGAGLDELTLTTNGSQLARYAECLSDCGIARIDHPLGRLRASDGRHRRSRPRRHQGQDQYGGAPQRERGRDRDVVALRAWEGLRPHSDRDHANGRDRQ
jgi:MoaA/NifB/PqqE/SkfB family radical SAM enzyme